MKSDDIINDRENGIERLLEIMRRLRDPETGCPWDIEQDFNSIAPYTIEEAYEVADAIARGDMEELREELGDLLLQVVFHARMAEEAGHFAFPEVVEAIVGKMIFRHPHVFGAAHQRGRVEADFWERAKEAERRGKGPSGPENEEERVTSALDGVALALPALVRAEKLQKRAARAGYDWPDAAGVVEKIAEEAEEVRTAAATGDAAATFHEIGDLLFSVVNLARHLGVDAEAALRAANDRFARRFRHAEAAAREKGRMLDSLTAEELDGLWREAKAAEKAVAGGDDDEERV